MKNLKTSAVLFLAKKKETRTFFFVMIAVFLVFSQRVVGQNIFYPKSPTNNKGNYNSCFGDQIMNHQTTTCSPFYNTAVGYGALSYDTSSFNTAIGAAALATADYGYQNTACGLEALRNIRREYSNTAIGEKANIIDNINLTNATAIGRSAIVKYSNAVQLGNSDVTQVFAGVGNKATLIAAGLKITGILGGAPGIGKVLTSNANGVATWQNPMVLQGDRGDKGPPGFPNGWALNGNKGTIDGIDFLGTTDAKPFTIRVTKYKELAGRIEFDPLKASTFFGAYSGYNSINGTRGNTATGLFSLFYNETGNYNTATGIFALNGSLKGEGSNNTASGYAAISSNISGNNNTANGYHALLKNKGGSGATAIGYDAMLYTNDQETPFDNYNVAVGYEALRGLYIEDPNIESNNTGNYNTALGYQTLLNNSSGKENTATGHQALMNNGVGEANTANGFEALTSNTSGKNNIASGYKALTSNTTGNNNTAIGFGALAGNTTGSNNTAVGNRAAATPEGLSNATAIGHNAKVSASNCLVLGNAANVGIGVDAPNPAYQLQLSFDSAAKPGGGVWTVASDKRLKKDISAFKDGLNVIQKINPVWFTYNGEGGMPTNKKWVGVIAQDMQEIAPYTIGTFNYQDATGRKKEYLDYDANAVIYILINSIKDQEQQIDELKKLITRLAARGNASTSMLEASIDLNDKNAIVLKENEANLSLGKSARGYDVP